jgi:FAD/FMN-containing dehydrogenase
MAHWSDLRSGATADATQRRRGRVVNDVHGQLHPTRVDRVVTPRSDDEVQASVAEARRQGRPLAISGARHSMGGQAFGRDVVLLDMTCLTDVLGFDPHRGLIEVQAGIDWPGVVGELLRAQHGWTRRWGIAQKQTGADRLTIGGAVSANVHGRGLRMKPFVADLENVTIVDAQGRRRRLSRHLDSDLFRLVVGGYGLFGVVVAATLRLVPRRKVERVVSVEAVEDLAGLFENRIVRGFQYGDFQFAVDAASPDFLRRGVFSCYRPVDPATPVTAEPRELSEEDWFGLLRLAHLAPTEAFRRYAEHYQGTAGQVYWSDTQQLGVYLDAYHARLDRALGATVPASEVITELYVPRPALAGFLGDAARELRRRGVPVIYGTVRLIERDDETFLAWAREPYACVVFNLHTEHSPAGIDRAAGAFRSLIDAALDRGGSFYLTYHRFATRQQVQAAYPQFGEFLKLKRHYDPDGLFQSDWYRHYARCSAPDLAGRVSS